jgi:hypothetical protein
VLGKVARTLQIAGNFIETQYTFKDRSRRVAEVDADEHDSFLRQHGMPARPFQRLAYTYDQTGNLTEFHNDAPFDPRMNPSVFVGTLQHDYEYDSLGRLLQARGTLQEEDHWRKRYSQDFAYSTATTTTTPAAIRPSGPSVPTNTASWCERREPDSRDSHRRSPALADDV